MKKETLQAIAKMYDLSREVVEKHYYFLKDLQAIKKYGLGGKYNESEWK